MLRGRRAVFDYLIIGAGSAGCVLANRLSKNPKNKVCLLEAGGRDTSRFIHMPAGLSRLVPPGSGDVNWEFWTAPQSQLNDRTLYWPRGRVLGGSSAINGMVYTRGSASDYDGWAHLGCKGWSYDEVLPYFRKAETSARGAGRYHGGDGPLHTQKVSTRNTLLSTFLSACESVGIERNPDFNGAELEGAARYDCTVHGGVRQSTATAYLKPAAGRPNLTVMTDASVKRLIVDGNKVTGAVIAREEEDESASARHVILSAGTIGTPHILMLSGIGPAEHLRETGIEPVLDSPDVGSNLQDHLDVLLQYRCNEAISFNRYLAWHQMPRVFLKWLLKKKGPGTNIPTPAGAFLKSRPDLETPDIQLHFMPAWGAAHGADLPTQPGFQIHVCALRPQSRGTIRLASKVPSQAPVIDPNYLSAPEDLGVMIEGVKWVRKIMDALPMAAVNLGERWPGSKAASDADIAVAIRQGAETIYHPVGTARMGADDGAVVDPKLKVRGLDGLYIADASIMPRLISGNTNAPTIMIAEKLADQLLKDSKAPTS